MNRYLRAATAGTLALTAVLRAGALVADLTRPETARPAAPNMFLCRVEESETGHVTLTGPQPAARLSAK